MIIGEQFIQKQEHFSGGGMGHSKKFFGAMHSKRPPSSKSRSATGRRCAMFISGCSLAHDCNFKRMEDLI